MAESNTNSILNQSKLLPSPFQCVNKSSSVSSNEVKLYGYQSNFDIKQQKQMYQQRKNHNFNQQRNSHNPHTNNNPQLKRNSVNSLNNRSNQKESGNWCNLCERGFKYPNQLQKHIDEHEKCWFEHCTFEGHKKLLQAHIENQHNSGLFQKFRKTETEEDIEKWREERRKRYPTAANIEARRLAQKERIKRGERLEKPNNRFGNILDRRSAKCRTFTDKQVPPFKQSNEKRKRNRHNRNNTKALKKEQSKEIESINDTKNKCGDVQSEKCSRPNEVPSSSEKNSNALTDLSGLYGSDSEESECEADCKLLNTQANSDESIPTKNESITNRHEFYNKRVSEDKVDLDHPSKQLKVDVENITPMDVFDQTIPKESDDELPEEQPIQHTSYDIDMKDQHCSGPTEIVSNKVESVKQTKVSRSKQTIIDMTHKIHKQNTLLEKLLQKEIRHERNILLQCVRYVVDNNFFGIGQENNTN